MSRRWTIAGLGSLVVAVLLRQRSPMGRGLVRARGWLGAQGRHGRRVIQGAWYRLAAHRGGATGPPEEAVGAVLVAFLGRIPSRERDQVLAHLPEDVRVLTAVLPRELKDLWQQTNRGVGSATTRR